MDQLLIEKLDKDLRNAAKSIDRNEARLLVSLYYRIQDSRIRANNQVKAVERQEDAKPSALLAYFAENNEKLESNIKVALDVFSANHPVGIWMRANVGVGPVIAAGLLAHIDIAKAPTAGHIWSFAGLTPKVTWEKGQKRPWNAELKTICAYKLGESFVKTCNHKDSFYGRHYTEQKQALIKMNDALEFADAAKAKLEKYKIGKSTDAYKAYSIGKLPPAHIHARARRFAVKLFLSHLHEIWSLHEYGKVVEPYSIAILGHAHPIRVPFSLASVQPSH